MGHRRLIVWSVVKFLHLLAFFSFCGRPNKCKNNNLKHERRCKKAAAGAQVPGASVSDSEMNVGQDSLILQEMTAAAADDDDDDDDDTNARGGGGTKI